MALPSQASRVLAQAESGGFVVQSPQVSRDVIRLSRAVDRLTGSVIFAALLFGGVTLYEGRQDYLRAGYADPGGFDLVVGFVQVRQSPDLMRHRGFPARMQVGRDD